jgi:TIR domain
MSTAPIQAMNVFISNAHEDIKQLRKLLKHLQVLELQGLVKVLYDRDITAGAKWEPMIMTYLNEAQIILLLISVDFMTSDYCFHVELERAMKKHEDEEAIVIPIILRPVEWKWASFGELQALPTNAIPIKDASWHSSDEAFLLSPTSHLCFDPSFVAPTLNLIQWEGRSCETLALTSLPRT